MSIKLLSAGFFQDLGQKPSETTQTPFAPLKRALGTQIIDPSLTIASSGATAGAPVVLVASLIRPIELLQNPRPLAVNATFLRTAREKTCAVRVTSGNSEIGDAHSQSGFPDQEDTLQLQLRFGDARPTSVGVLDLSLRWELTSELGVDTTRTTHRMFVILGAPRTPWSMDLARPDRWLWAEVLEQACAWAAGAASADDAVRGVTNGVNALGGDPEERGLRYEGSPHYTLQPFRFDCAGFIRHLQGDQTSPGAFVNCSDVATIVSTFANALGCDLSQAQCLAGDPVQKVVLIGGVDPMHFSFHELAWSGASAEHDPVSDACLTLEGQVLSMIPFDDYSPSVFEKPAPGRIGQTFPENRAVGLKTAEVAPPPIDENVSIRLRTRHPEINEMVFPPDSASLPPDWTPGLNAAPATPIVQGERAWEFFLTPPDFPFSDGSEVDSQTRARLSLFETPDQALQYFFYRLTDVSERLVQWPSTSGVAISTNRAKTVVYKTANLVIVIQLRFGELDLKAKLQQLITVLALS